MFHREVFLSISCWNSKTMRVIQYLEMFVARFFSENRARLTTNCLYRMNVSILINIDTI